MIYHLLYDTSDDHIDDGGGELVAVVWKFVVLFVFQLWNVMFNMDGITLTLI